MGSAVLGEKNGPTCVIVYTLEVLVLCFRCEEIGCGVRAFVAFLDDKLMRSTNGQHYLRCGQSLAAFELWLRRRYWDKPRGGVHRAVAR